MKPGTCFLAGKKEKSVNLFILFFSLAGNGGNGLIFLFPSPQEVYLGPSCPHGGGNPSALMENVEWENRNGGFSLYFKAALHEKKEIKSSFQLKEEKR